MDCKLNLIAFGLLVLCLTQACHAELMCYVCENCDKVDMNTPKKACNEQFFSTGSTLPSTMTTTTEPATISTTTSTSTSTSTQTNEPTPPTVGPPVTTSAMPTPPNISIATPTSEVVVVQHTEPSSTTEGATTMTHNSSEEGHTTPAAFNVFGNVGSRSMENSGAPLNVTHNATTVLHSANSTMFNVRQRRHAEHSVYSFHCYSIQKKGENNTMITDRGCSRKTSQVSVCQQLKNDNSSTEIKKCVPCANSLCNSSTTFGVSLLTIAISVLVTLIGRH